MSQGEQLRGHGDTLTFCLVGQLALSFGLFALTRELAGAFALGRFLLQATDALGHGLRFGQDIGAAGHQALAIIEAQMRVGQCHLAGGQISSMARLPSTDELLVQALVVLALRALEIALLLALELSLRFLQHEVENLLAPLRLRRGGEEKAGSNKEIQEPTSHGAPPCQWRDKAGDLLNLSRMPR